MSKVFVVALGLLLLLARTVVAQPPAELEALHAKIRATKGPIEATEPLTTGGADYHKNFMRMAKEHQYPVVFFGASDVMGWSTTGRDQWREYFEPVRAGAFSAGEQPIGHLLWRLQHGLLEGYEPKVVVLSPGPPTVNAIHGCEAKEIAAGIEACVKEIQSRQPKAKVIVMSAVAIKWSIISQRAADTAKEANQLIAKLDNGKTVRVLDFNPEIVANLDKLGEELARVDNPHKVTLVYKLWARPLRLAIDDMLK